MKTCFFLIYLKIPRHFLALIRSIWITSFGMKIKIMLKIAQLQNCCCKYWLSEFKIHQRIIELEMDRSIVIIKVFLPQSSNDLCRGLSLIDSSAREGCLLLSICHTCFAWKKRFLEEVVLPYADFKKRDPPIFSALKSVCYAVVKCFILAQLVRFGIEQLISRDVVIGSFVEFYNVVSVS